MLVPVKGTGILECGLVGGSVDSRSLGNTRVIPALYNCSYALKPSEEFLRKFAVRGEVMKIDPDEFDYIFYTYGLQLYENMPLIEPLEYREAKRIREFVIAIDTSGSVAGDLVQTFVQKTYNVLKSTESFFSKINLHVIQLRRRLFRVRHRDHTAVHSHHHGVFCCKKTADGHVPSAVCCSEYQMGQAASLLRTRDITISRRSALF